MKGTHVVVTPYAPVADVWRKGPRVRMDTLRKGQSFTDISGQRWTYDRLDGASSGVHHVYPLRDSARDTRTPTCFAGCAEVVPLSQDTPVTSAILEGWRP